MRASEDGVVRHYGTCLFIDAVTGEECRVSLAYVERDGEVWLEATFDGVPGEPRHVPQVSFRWWRTHLHFDAPTDPPGRAAPATLMVADPVSIDGSPRNKLRDRLARRGWEAEAMAAD